MRSIWSWWGRVEDWLRLEYMGGMSEWGKGLVHLGVDRGHVRRVGIIWWDGCMEGGTHRVGLNAGLEADAARWFGIWSVTHRVIYDNGIITVRLSEVIAFRWPMILNQQSIDPWTKNAANWTRNEWHPEVVVRIPSEHKNDEIRLDQDWLR